MNPAPGYHLITPDDLHWRPSNLMKIPNADFLERTGSVNLGARLWRMPPMSANTLHKHSLGGRSLNFELFDPGSPPNPWVYSQPPDGLRCASS